MSPYTVHFCKHFTHLLAFILHTVTAVGSPSLSSSYRHCRRVTESVLPSLHPPPPPPRHHLHHYCLRNLTFFCHIFLSNIKFVVACVASVGVPTRHSSFHRRAALVVSGQVLLASAYRRRCRDLVRIGQLSPLIFPLSAFSQVAVLQLSLRTVSAQCLWMCCSRWLGRTMPGGESLSLLFRRLTSTRSLCTRQVISLGLVSGVRILTVRNAGCIFRRTTVLFIEGLYSVTTVRATSQRRALNSRRFGLLVVGRERV